jgi:hypothetical protein
MQMRIGQTCSDKERFSLCNGGIDEILVLRVRGSHNARDILEPLHPRNSIHKFSSKINPTDREKGSWYSERKTHNVFQIEIGFTAMSEMGTGNLLQGERSGVGVQKGLIFADEYLQRVNFKTRRKREKAY